MGCAPLARGGNSTVFPSTCGPVASFTVLIIRQASSIMFNNNTGGVLVSGGTFNNISQNEIDPREGNPCCLILMQFADSCSR